MAYESSAHITADDNSDFWQIFLEKNLQYQTAPFGGNNPVFVPNVTDARQYEEKYVEN
jgi:hypothetical protein